MSGYRLRTRTGLKMTPKGFERLVADLDGFPDIVAALRLVFAFQDEEEEE